MENQALIFIPDISGFTKFVTKCEINHTNHIISNLINIILDSNPLDLKVSEIEGDAVLFYFKGMPPKKEEIIQQSKRMFIDFHTNLKAMERNFFCKSGSCTTASNLTLKFIVHYGVCKEVPIHNSPKLMGSDVILAHKLLKNNIPEREYILLSEKYLKSQQSKLIIEEDWVDIKSNIENFENFGEIRTKYIPLSPLKRLIP
ncbi:MAG: DUF2652 domain-containing protein [Desulfobacterales bacterium]|uniref:DUF2652 domain-containing protein n=1 Tax=Candidatus Desulfatibia vada TaxID=2841696 RepID=A0A8J6NUR7_9BACT|nr:DUF2652 domain-containing protein [Candidatus Desulfatibia vada]